MRVTIDKSVPGLHQWLDSIDPRSRAKAITHLIQIGFHHSGHHQPARPQKRTRSVIPPLAARTKVVQEEKTVSKELVDRQQMVAASDGSGIGLPVSQLGFDMGFFMPK